MKLVLTNLHFFQNLQASAEAGEFDRKYSISEAIGGTLLYLKLRIQIYQQRQALKRLTNEQLEDIGLTREQALNESRKTFWRR